MSRSIPDKGEVRAAITVGSFPATMEDLEWLVGEPASGKPTNMLGRLAQSVWRIPKVHALVTEDTTLLGQLLDPDTGPLEWTAPPWADKGDILLFYHAGRALLNAKRLLGQVKAKYGEKDHLTAYVEQAIKEGEKYGGTIFGCAVVTDKAKREETDPDACFKGRVFAPCGQLYPFAKPVPLASFQHKIRITQQTIIPLSGSQFDCIRDSLASNGGLPRVLKKVRGVDGTFAGITKQNWPEYAQHEPSMFLSEDLLRSYLLDYLLELVGDSDAHLVQEADTFRKSKKTGRADYFVKVYGRWIPVEAKVNVLVELDLKSQLRRYCGTDAFAELVEGGAHERVELAPHPLGIVADQAGVYMTRDGDFLDCEPGQPLWPREKLDVSTAKEIREWINAHSD